MADTNDNLLSERWTDVQSAENKYYAAQQAFGATVNHLLQTTDQHKVGAFLLKKLQSPSSRRTALILIFSLPGIVKEIVFPKLIELASISNSDLSLEREVILSLNRDWVNEHILPEIARILLDDTEDATDTFRRVLELLVLLESPHIAYVIDLAQKSEDSEVHELAHEDWNNRDLLRLRIWS